MSILDLLLDTQGAFSPVCRGCAICSDKPGNKVDSDGAIPLTTMIERLDDWLEARQFIQVSATCLTADVS